MRTEPRSSGLTRLWGSIEGRRWSLFLTQVRLLTLHNGRDKNEVAINLTLALEGAGLQDLAVRPLDKHQDIDQLIGAL